MGNSVLLNELVLGFEGVGVHHDLKTEWSPHNVSSNGQSFVRQ